MVILLNPYIHEGRIIPRGTQMTFSADFEKALVENQNAEYLDDDYEDTNWNEDYEIDEDLELDESSTSDETQQDDSLDDEAHESDSELSQTTFGRGGSK